MPARILIPNDNLTDERKKQLIDQLALLQEKIDAEVEFVNQEDIPERKEVDEVQIFHKMPVPDVTMMAPMGYYPSGKENRRARREREREARKRRR